MAYAGILLRRLLSDKDLQGTTHVIVDEVHERSVDSDLLLFLLRELLFRKGSAAPKIILMSATAEAHLFASYFSSSSEASPFLAYEKASLDPYGQYKHLCLVIVCHQNAFVS